MISASSSTRLDLIRTKQSTMKDKLKLIVAEIRSGKNLEERL
jgi:hypothetical protein